MNEISVRSTLQTSDHDVVDCQTDAERYDRGKDGAVRSRKPGSDVP